MLQRVRLNYIVLQEHSYVLVRAQVWFVRLEKGVTWKGKSQNTLSRHNL